MATPQTPRAARSPLARYAPLIAVVVVIAIVAVVIGIVGGGKKTKKDTVSTNTNAPGSATQKFTDVPIFYNEAKAAGTLAKYTWQPHCDTSTGDVAIPILLPPPCVPAGPANNGGATSPGVTADSIKIGYFIGKPDPLFDSALKAAGAYDAPDASARAFQSYVGIYKSLYELYGRKIDLVRIDGTGSSTDEVAAKSDADKAADKGVFAVMGGPTQTRSFEAELARRHVLCIAACVTASPESIVAREAPYSWGTGPTPEQGGRMVTELIKNQLLGKDAVYGGDDVKNKKRTFALLSYDTPDGKYKASWDQFYSDMKAAGIPLVGHISYFLNFSSLPADATTISNRLKATGATSIVFTGDPIFPATLTKDMTQQGYFPEWVMGGTVLADTNVFARTFDQEQWKHAFGLQLIPAKLPKTSQDAYTLHEWWYGTKPPTDNNFAIVDGEVQLLFAGLQSAGPNLTPETFRDGLFHGPPQDPGPSSIGFVDTYGSHGYWSGTDYGGLDNAGVLYWDPNVTGPDETGNIGKGMYRLMNGGKRYLPGHWPTEPLKFFDPAGTITIYNANNIPPDVTPKSEPLPSDAPAAKK